MSLAYEIYSPDRKNRHELTHAVSISQELCYNAIGRITITADANDYNIMILQQGSIVLDRRGPDPKRWPTYVLENPRVDTSNNQITANGYSCNWLLNKRCIINRLKVTDAATGGYQATQANLRGLEGMRVGDVSPGPAPVTHELYGGQLLDEIIPMLDKAELGHRVVWDDDTRSHTFEIYKGRDLTQGIHAAVFSELQGTANNLSIDQDSSKLKNYFYVPVKWSNDVEEWLEFGDKEAPDRREYWIKSKVSQTGGKSREAVKAEAKQKAEDEAQKRLSRHNFTVDIKAEELGRAYDLGDKVRCVSERLGISFTARITGVSYKMDINGETTSIVLGEPTLTALDEVMMDR